MMSTIEMHDRLDATHPERVRSVRAEGADASAIAMRDVVDDASFDSFPASDPPSWMSVRVGPPDDVR